VKNMHLQSSESARMTPLITVQISWLMNECLSTSTINIITIE